MGNPISIQTSTYQLKIYLDRSINFAVKKSRYKSIPKLHSLVDGKGAIKVVNKIMNYN